MMISYLIKFNISTLALLIGYLLLIRGKINPTKARLFLIGSLLFSAIIPAIHIGLPVAEYTQKNPFQYLNDAIDEQLYTFSNGTTEAEFLRYRTILPIIYFLGFIVMITRLVYNIFKIKKLENISVSEVQFGQKVYNLKHCQTAFSFFHL